MLINFILYGIFRKRLKNHKCIAPGPFRSLSILFCMICMLDLALFNFLRLTIVAKNSFLNVTELLDSSWKLRHAQKLVRFSWGNQCFFLLFWNMVNSITSKYIFFLSILFYRMMNFLSILLDICYNYLVFMDLVIGFSKSKLLFRIASFIKM